MEKILRELDERNSELRASLFAIQSSVAIYSVISLNASKIETGNFFFGAIQNQQIKLIVIEFSKIFEKEGKKYKLNSVPSIVKFIEENKIEPKNPQAISDYLEKGEIVKGGSWIFDLNELIGKQYQKNRPEILRIDNARNTRFAHSQAEAPKKDLPSVAVFEELLRIAYGFHDFVNAAFLDVRSHPILTDTQVRTSLENLLQKIGISDVTTEFPD